MRSLIISIVILILITGFAAFHTVTAAKRAGDLDGLFGEDGTPADPDGISDAWERLEAILRITVHEERLRSARTALAEYVAAAKNGAAEREAGLLRRAIEEAAVRERFSLWQVF